MTIFENYTANMPMMFPTKKFATELSQKHNMLADLTFYKIYGLEEPIDPGNPNNLNNPEIFAKWLDTFDFYDETNMPHCLYYDSWDELVALIVDTTWVDLENISRKMKLFNIQRRALVYAKWAKILDKLARRIGG
jgi:hypothetical protein